MIVESSHIKYQADTHTKQSDRPKLTRNIFDNLSKSILKAWENGDRESVFSRLDYLKRFDIKNGVVNNLNQGSTLENVKNYLNEVKAGIDAPKLNNSESVKRFTEGFDTSEMVKAFKEAGFKDVIKVIVIIPDSYDSQSGYFGFTRNDIDGLYGEGIKLVLPNGGSVILTALHNAGDIEESQNKPTGINSVIPKIKFILNTRGTPALLASDDSKYKVIGDNGIANTDIEELRTDQLAWYINDPRVSLDVTIIGNKKEVNEAAKLLLGMKIASSYQIRANLASNKPVVSTVFSNRVTTFTSNSTSLGAPISGMYTTNSYPSTVPALSSSNSVDYTDPGKAFVQFSTPGNGIGHYLQPRVAFDGTSGVIGYAKDDKGTTYLTTYHGAVVFGKHDFHDPKIVEHVKSQLRENTKLSNPYINFFLTKYPDMTREDALHTVASFASIDGLSKASFFTFEFLTELYLKTSEGKESPSF